MTDFSSSLQNAINSVPSSSQLREPSDLFQSLVFFVEVSGVPNRPKFIRSIRNAGGETSTSPKDASIILVNPANEESAQLGEDWINEPGKVVLDCNWVKHCLRNGKLFGAEDGWASFQFVPGDRVFAGDEDDNDDPMDTQPQQPTPRPTPKALSELTLTKVETAPRDPSPLAKPLRISTSFTAATPSTKLSKVASPSIGNEAGSLNYQQFQEMYRAYQEARAGQVAGASANHDPEVQAFATFASQNLQTIASTPADASPIPIPQYKPPSLAQKGQRQVARPSILPTKRKAPSEDAETLSSQKSETPGGSPTISHLRGLVAAVFTPNGSEGSSSSPSVTLSPMSLQSPPLPQGPAPGVRIFAMDGTEPRRFFMQVDKGRGNAARIVKRHGGVLTSDIASAHCAILFPKSRSYNAVLATIKAARKPAVSDSWLQACDAAGALLPWDDYLLGGTGSPKKRRKSVQEDVPITPKKEPKDSRKGPRQKVSILSSVLPESPPRGGQDAPVTTEDLVQTKEIEAEMVKLLITGGAQPDRKAVFNALTNIFTQHTYAFFERYYWANHETIQRRVDFGLKGALPSSSTDASTTLLPDEPEPPKHIERKPNGKCKYTDEDYRFLLSYFRWVWTRDPQCPMGHIMKRVAQLAPHHSAASWGYAAYQKHDEVDAIKLELCYIDNAPPPKRGDAPPSGPSRLRTVKSYNEDDSEPESEDEVDELHLYRGRSIED